MIYEMQTKSNLTEGAMLVVRFPEEELDRKALYTIQADQPDFLVPFRYRSIDGQIECTYLLGNRSKLQYRFGSHTADEYVELWSQVLQPLLDCGDWFLKPFSFILDTKHLYVDKNTKTVSFLYIPSVKDCVAYDDLREMMTELSRKNSVKDPNLENKVLRAIMQELGPKQFLEMLRESRPAVAEAKNETPPAPGKPPVSATPSVQPVEPVQEEKPDPKPTPAPQPSGREMDDIVIDLDGGGGKKGKKEKKEKGKGLFGGKKEKKAPAKEPKKGGLFGKKEPVKKEIVLGAAAEPIPQKPVQQTPANTPAQVWMAPTEENEVTQLLDRAEGVPCLRLVGDPSLPREISVEIQPGRAFTVGRFDVTVGHKQSDFEFDKRTSAVSRHHAAIERDGNGRYVVVDLASSAGTFVNGQRLTPNVGYMLEQGCKVAFGTGGADYIWEE